MRVAAVVGSLLVGGCGASAQVSTSPFPVDTTLFAAVLDAITAREVDGEVRVVVAPVERPATSEVPTPVMLAAEPAALRVRRSTILQIGFRLDSVMTVGECPGRWAEVDRRELCPASPRTTVAVSLPWTLEGEELRRATRRSSLSGIPPTQAVTVMFLFAGPAGSGIIVTEYYAGRLPGGRWVVTGKRVIFQTE